ncbi:G-protein coupled receptor Mth2-like [Argiope bruennichi]|uniref:G-protein coupled receptor Mth2-like n=1 Tax=Argiope bruennichi TaxID=94029 RepID=UPI002495075F|nr:G-protein coupled receptor Mth2-like [Argiope bruennichi]
MKLYANAAFGDEISPQFNPLCMIPYLCAENTTHISEEDLIPYPNTDFPLNLWNDTEDFYVGDYNSSYAVTANLTNLTNLQARNRNVSRYYPIIIVEMIASCLCLIFSIIVYSILPEFRNVHGKNLISMSSCMLTTFLLLILDLIIRKHIPFQVCFTLAMIIHVTFLATFFWTNVMAFDIFRSLTNMKAKAEVANTSKKYLKYSVYAWTATILTALPAAIFELTDLVSLKYRPKFGVKRCWLSGTPAFIYYFNLPVGIILFCNLVLFLLIIRKLRIIKKMTAILNVKQHQERFHLYLKLFLVMGITWTTEFLPWVTGVYWLYAIAGMLTALHGCFLFFIFVCKKRILKAFFQKIWQNKKSSTLTPSTSSQQTLSSDQNRKQSLDQLSESKF